MEEAQEERKAGAVNQAPSKKRTRCWYGCRDKRKWYQGRGPEIQTASVKAEPHTVVQHCGKAVMKRSESEGKGATQRKRMLKKRRPKNVAGCYWNLLQIPFFRFFIQGGGHSRNTEKVNQTMV